MRIPNNGTVSGVLWGVLVGAVVLMFPPMEMTNHRVKGALCDLNLHLPMRYHALPADPRLPEPKRFPSSKRTDN